MKIKFSEKTDKIIKNLALEAKNFGVKIYFVGGLVRDIIMGIEPLDIDILVEGDAIDFITSLDFVDIKSVHKDFGTIKTQIEGIEIDFASTRKEFYPLSGCLPEVVELGCFIEDDLVRRDFTINAIALEILPEGNYRLIDKFSGCDDIKNRTLKVLHENSYIDDPTRILRGLDFKLRFNFDFSENDKKLINEYLKSPSREGLSVDRVILTLNKLFSSNLRAKEAFREFVDKKYYRILFDNKDLSCKKIFDAIEKFKIKDYSKVLIKYIFTEPFDVPELKTRLEIYKYFKHYNTDEICVYYANTKDERALLYFSKLKDIKLNIKGSDLLNLGYKEGKQIGLMLDKVLEARLEENSSVSSLNDEIEFVKKNTIL